jgi:RimJ/RimL family protein N-acetyltransferase
MDPILVSHVQLREIEEDDLPRLWEFNLEPDSNRLAMTISRGADAFAVGNVLAGSISCFKHDGLNNIGYWLGQDFWGKGVGSRALELLLKEIQPRPLYARVATTNRASLRVLQKCGFVVQSVHLSPADDRYLECEETLLVLK